MNVMAAYSHVRDCERLRLGGFVEHVQSFVLSGKGERFDLTVVTSFKLE